MTIETQTDLFNLPQDYVNEMKDAFGGEGIRLPFTVTYWRWMNGQSVYKGIGSAPYFGGWAANVEDVEVAMAEYGPLPMFDPKTKKGSFAGPFTLSKRDGGEYDVYTARALAVAVIGKRERWVVNADQPGDKGRGHTQVLGLAGYRGEDGTIQPWGPVVLTARGLAALNIRNAFRDFERKTQRPRSQFARNIPAWFFYAIVGTFGDKPQVQMAGKTGAQSPISPCNLYLPEGEITAEALKTWYVGEGMVEQLIDLRHQANEWLSDDNWKSGKEAQKEDAAPEGPENWPDDDQSGVVPF